MDTLDMMEHGSVTTRLAVAGLMMRDDDIGGDTPLDLDIGNMEEEGDDDAT